MSRRTTPGDDYVDSLVATITKPENIQKVNDAVRRLVDLPDLPYVPFDNMPALLHRGEAVLTQADVEQWRKRRAEVEERGMTDRLAAAISELVDAIRAEMEPMFTIERLPERLLSIAEAASMLGIGRSMLYQEISAGRLRSIKVGRRRLVPISAIRDRIG